jgi:acyl-coenzyme A thioesterase PaaI-like protein
MSDGVSSASLGRLQRDDSSNDMYAPRSETGVVLCNSCRAAATCRLGLERETLGDDGIVVSEIQCPRDNEGGRNVAHGGWTAGILDEMVGHAVLMRDEFAVTGTLTVTFVKPVPVERPLIGRAGIVRREGRRVFVEASLELVDNGVVVASAEAILVRRPADHFDRHDKWLRELDAAGARGEHISGLYSG